MSRTIHWDDEFCPNGHRWQFIASSTLFPDYYYCATDDTFWEPTVRKTEPQEIQRRFNVGRPEEMKRLAVFLTWKESLTPKDMEQICAEQS